MTSRRSTRRTTLLGSAGAVPARARPDGLHADRRPGGRAGRRPRRAARRRPVHAVDDGDPLDRGGRRRQSGRAALVPGVRLAGPRPGHATWSSARPAAGYEALVITVDTANLGRRERDVRRGLHAAAEARPRHDPRRRRPPGLDVAIRRSEPIVFANVATSRSPAALRRFNGRSRLAEKVSSQFDPACRGPTSSGSARCGTGRSCSRGSSPSPTPARRRPRRRRDRPVQPRWPPARQRPGDPRPRRPVADAVGAAHRDHLRRRGAAGERHRQGAGARRRRRA